MEREGSPIGRHSAAAVTLRKQCSEAWDLGRSIPFSPKHDPGAPPSLVNELVELALNLLMVGVYLMAWFSRNLLLFLPESVSLYNFCSTLQSGIFSTAIRSDAPAPVVEAGEDVVGETGDGAVERALVQVLALMNGIPQTSIKYVFARDLAEKIIQENNCHGQECGLVNRAALTTGFNRTLALLNRTLASIPQRQAQRGMAWNLHTKLLSLVSSIPQKGMQLVLPPTPNLAQRWAQVAGLIPFMSARGANIGTRNSRSRAFAPEPSPIFLADEEQAEKLARELLWLAEKLAESSALDGCIRHWSSAVSLSEMSLSATPRLQRALVRLTALFLDEVVANTRVDVDGTVRFKMLLLWLPLLCAATHGGDGPIFTSSEKVKLERALHSAVKALPEGEQETILGIWLQEFLRSSSDWPNLQPCYDEWCDTSRKQRHQLRLEYSREESKRK